nr:Protein C15A11.7, isoform a [Haemonchus contortus]
MKQAKLAKKNLFRKYFWEGQHLDESSPQQDLPDDADFLDVILIKYRKYVAVLIPLVVMQTFWWLTAIRYSWLSLYRTHWELPAIMLLGSTVAGMTSEGGGAVAFPVMTLGLKLAPSTARDFSLIVQAIGMTCALFVIVFMGVQIEKRAVVFGMMGSVPGFIFGSLLVDPFFTGPQKKMLFVSIWSSFAVALYLLNAEKKRKTYYVIPEFKPWKAFVLSCTGFIGGIFTAFTGSGVDICIFSIITLLFRVSEKIATPTTIVLMGLNSIIGVYYRVVWENGVSELALDYIKITIPVAVTLAPIGSFLGSHFHRKVTVDAPRVSGNEGVRYTELTVFPGGEHK